MTDTVHPSNPDHPHHSFWQSARDFFAKLAKEAPHVLPYVAEAATVAAKVGVHMSPQATIAVQVITEIAAAAESQKSAPTNSTPQP